MSSKTSIVLCTYNEANYIENTISELEKNISNLELVIVDDNSSDGTVEIIRKLNKNNKYKVVFRKKSRSLASAFVRGVVETTGENIGWIDTNMGELASKFPEMIEELKEYRALTYLGHKSDIFTLTCEESVKLCLPLITFGIGSISDRVQHNETGFLVKNDQGFADYTIKLLNNDDFYLDLRKKMHQIRHKNSWVDIANQWVENFLSE